MTEILWQGIKVANFLFIPPYCSKEEALYLVFPVIVIDIEQIFSVLVKFMYSEKATKCCEIFPLLLTTVHTVKSKKKISQNYSQNI